MPDPLNDVSDHKSFGNESIIQSENVLVETDISDSQNHDTDSFVSAEDNVELEGIKMQDSESQEQANNAIFSCIHCDKTFDCQDDLTKHKTFVRCHLKAATLSRNFNSEGSLDRTVSKKSTSSKSRHAQWQLAVQLASGSTTGKFSCSYCDYRNDKEYYMEIHERIHTGEKPFKCSQCDKNFASKTILTRHEQFHKKKTQKTEEEGSDFFLSAVRESKAKNPRLQHVPIF